MPRHGEPQRLFPLSRRFAASCPPVRPSARRSFLVVGSLFFKPSAPSRRPVRPAGWGHLKTPWHRGRGLHTTRPRRRHVGEPWGARGASVTA